MISGKKSSILSKGHFSLLGGENEKKFSEKVVSSFGVVLNIKCSSNRSHVQNTCPFMSKVFFNIKRKIIHLALCAILQTQ
jgi:hypothetical protein